MPQLSPFPTQSSSWHGMVDHPNGVRPDRPACDQPTTGTGIGTRSPASGITTTRARPPTSRAASATAASSDGAGRAKVGRTVASSRPETRSSV